MSVMDVVDGQETGLSVQLAEKKSALVQASLHLKHQPTNQLKERDL